MVKKLVQVGVGLWGMGWLDVVRQSRDLELGAVVDIDQGSLDRACAIHGLSPQQCSRNLGAAAEATGPDAVLIAVPPPYHSAVALEALELGLDCLIEKPLAPTLAEAHAIVERAEAAGRVVMVSQNYRFKRAPQTVRCLVERGAVGKIGQVAIWFQKAPQFTGFRADMDEPLILDMAIHHFDLIRGVLRLEPISVRAHSFNPHWSYFKGNASALVEFQTETGAIISYFGTWVNRRQATTWDGDWDIQGERGAIEWAHNRVVLRPETIFDTVYQPGTLERENLLDADLVVLTAEDRHGSLAEFARALEEGRQPETNGRDNLRSLALVIATIEASRTGEEVAIDRLLTVG